MRKIWVYGWIGCLILLLGEMRALDRDFVSNVVKSWYVSIVFGSSDTVTVNTPGDVALAQKNQTYSGDTHIIYGLFWGNADRSKPLDLDAQATVFSPNSLIILDDRAGASLRPHGVDSLPNQTLGPISGGGSNGGSLMLPPGQTVKLNQSSDQIFGGTISGQDAILIKQGSGTLILTGTSSLSGGWILDEGVISISSGANLGESSSSSTLDFKGGTLEVTNTLILEHSITLQAAGGIFDIISDQTATIASPVDGIGDLTKNGEGTLALDAVSTYSGETLLEQGTLQALADNPMGSSSDVTLSDVVGVLLDVNDHDVTVNNLSGGGSSGGDIALGNSGRLTVHNGKGTTFSGSVTGSGIITKEGSGSWGVDSLKYKGSLHINEGIVIQNVLNALSESIVVHFADVASAVLRLNDFTTRLKNISGGGSNGGDIFMGNASDLFVGDNQPTSSYGGGISGSGHFHKQGSGTLILSGTNVYTGDTFIKEGELHIGGSDALPDDTTVYLEDAFGVVLNLLGQDQTVSGVFGGGSSGGNINLGSATLTIDTSYSGTNSYDGVMSGTGNVVKSGTGELRLFGNNTFSGGVTINDGIVGIAQDSSLGTGTVTLDGGSLSIYNSCALSNDFVLADTTSENEISVNDKVRLEMSGSFSGSGDLKKSGAGRLVFSGTPHTYTGDTYIAEGTVLNGGGNPFAPSSTFFISSGAVLDLQGFDTVLANLKDPSSGGTGDILLGGATLVIGDSSNAEFSGTISGAGNFVKQGSGYVELHGQNQYGGDTSILEGQLRLEVPMAIPNDRRLFCASGAELRLDGHDLSVSHLSGDGTILTGDPGSAAGNLIVALLNDPVTGVPLHCQFSGIISGSKDLIKEGEGDLTLLGSNDYSGDTIIREGRILLGASGVLPSTTVVSLLSPNAALSLQGHDTTIVGIDGTGSVLLEGGIFTVEQGATGSLYSGNIEGEGSLVKQGTGELTLAGINSYSGSTTIREGLLSLHVASAIPDTTNVVLEGTGQLNIGGHDISVVSLSGTSGTLDLGGGSLSVRHSGAQTFAGVITDGIPGEDGSIIMDGSGFLTLTGTNTYRGGTFIRNGILAVSNDNNLGTGDVFFSNNATLRFLSSTSSTKDIHLEGDGILDVPSSVTLTLSGNIDGEGSLTKLSPGDVILSGTNIYRGDTKIVDGTLQLGSDLALPETTNVLLSNEPLASLDVGSFDITVGNIHGGGSAGGDVILNGGTLRVGSNNTDADYRGIIQGTGDLVKIGSGRLTLYGANAYSGKMIIEAGIVQAGSNQAIPANLDVEFLNAGGAELQLNSYDTTVKSLSGGGDAGGNIILDTATLIVDTATGVTHDFSGNIRGRGSLIVQGSGTLVLSGLNNYRGETMLHDTSTLSISRDYNIGPGMIVFDGGELAVTANVTLEHDIVFMGEGVFDVSPSGSVLDLVGSITGTEGITKKGDGILQLSTRAAHSGANSIEEGTLRLGMSEALPPLSSIALTDISGAALDLNDIDTTVSSLTGGGSSGGDVLLGSAILTVDSNNSFSFDGKIVGTGGLVKEGAGTFTLSNVLNNYSGKTVVNNGILQAGDSGAISPNSDVELFSSNAHMGILDLNNFDTAIGTLSGGGDVLLGSATLTINEHETTGFAGSIHGTGDVRKQGSGILVLFGSNDYSGKTFVQAGGLQINNENALPDTSHVQFSNVNGAFLNLNHLDKTIGAISGGGPLGGNILLGSGTLTVENTTDTTFSGKIQGLGNLTKQGSGSLTLDGTNEYHGETRILEGQIVLASETALPAENDVILGIHATALLDVSANAQTIIGSIAGGSSSGGHIALGDGELIVGAPNNTTEFKGNIVGGVGILTKEGSGILTLSGNNTYGGETRILEGTLSVSREDNLGSGGIVLQEGEFQATESFSMARDVTVNQFGRIWVDLSKVLEIDGSFLGAGDLIKDGAGTVTLSQESPSYNGDITIVKGVLQAGADQTIPSNSLITFANFLGAALDIDGHNVVVENISGGGNIGGDILLGTGGEFTVGDDTDQIYHGSIQEEGDLIKQGKGVLTLAGVNEYVGDTTISEGTLQARSTQAFSSGGDLYISKTSPAILDLDGYDNEIGNLSGGGHILLGEAVLTIHQDQDGSYSGNISGPLGSLVKKGTGILTLEGTNTYQNSDIYDGGIQISREDQLGSGRVFFDNGTLIVSGVTPVFLSNPMILHLEGGDMKVEAGSTLNVNGAISGVGDLKKLGEGTLVLGSIDNSYTGVTNIEDGILKLAVDQAIPLSSSHVVLSDVSGIFLDLNGFSCTLHNIEGGGSNGGWIDLGNGGELNLRVIQESKEYQGKIQGTGSLIKSGPGLLTLGLPNSYVGKTLIQEGILKAKVVGSFPSGGQYVFENRFGAALDLNGHDLTMSNISGGGEAGGNILLGSAALTVDCVVLNEYSGSIKESGDLIKEGVGTFVLNGRNDYSGETQLNAGRMELGRKGALPLQTTVIFSNSELTILDLRNYDLIVQNISGGGNNLAEILLGSAMLQVGDSTPLSTYSGKISGEMGGLLKNGSGELKLTGEGDYKGPTIVSDGKLTIAADLALSPLTNVIIHNVADAILNIDGVDVTVQSLSGGGHRGGELHIDGGSFAILGDASTTFSGVIQGTSAEFIKAGTGILTIDGSNLYSGSTIFRGGAISISDADNLGTSQLVFDGGTLITTQNIFINQPVEMAQDGTIDVAPGTTLTLSGIVSSSGQLIKENDGVLILTGSNTYAGTILKGGELQGDVDSLQGPIITEPSSKVVFHQIQDGDYNDTISGKGSVWKTGGGTLAFTVDQQYSGGTIIFDGGLKGNSNSLQGSIQNYGEIIFDQDVDGTFSGIISGGGSIVKDNVGTLTFEDPQNYHGSLSVDRGAINGNSASLLGEITNNATVTLTQKVPGTFSGVLKGDGDLHIQGEELAITSISPTYSGTVHVQNKNVYVRGELAGDYIVYIGSRLSGIGRVGSVHNYGMVSPGSSIGTLTVQGDFIQDAAATLEIEIDPSGAADLLQVTGDAYLNGTLSVSPRPGKYSKDQTFTIVASDGQINGVFSSVISSNYMNLQAHYLNNLVQLVTTSEAVLQKSGCCCPLLGSGGLGGDPFDDTPLSRYDDPDVLNLNPEWKDIVDYVGSLTGEERIAAIQQILSEIPGGIILANFEDMYRMHNEWLKSIGCVDCLSRLSEGVCCKIGVVGNHSNFDLCDDTCIAWPNFWYHSIGASASGVFFCNDFIKFATGLGYLRSKVQWEQQRANVLQHSLYASEAFLACGGGFYVDLLASYGLHLCDASRVISLDDKEFIAQSSFHIHEVGTRGCIGLNLIFSENADPFYTRFYAAIDNLNVFSPTVLEKGADYMDLEMRKRHYMYSRPAVGFDITKAFFVGHAWVQPSVGVAWAHFTTIFSPSTIKERLYRLNLPDQTESQFWMLVRGYNKTLNQIQVQASLCIRGERFGINVFYGGFFLDGVITHGGSGSFNVHF